MGIGKTTTLRISFRFKILIIAAFVFTWSLLWYRFGVFSAGHYGCMKMSYSIDGITQEHVRKDNSLLEMIATKKYVTVDKASNIYSTTHRGLKNDITNDKGYVTKGYKVSAPNQLRDEIAFDFKTVTLYIKDLLQYVGEEGVNEIIAKHISSYNCNATNIFDGRQYPLEVDVKRLLKQYNKQRAIHIPVVNKLFKVLLNPEHKCLVRDKDIFLIFIVKTAPQNFERRKTIRKTWGNEGRFTNTRIVFSIGVPSEQKTLDKIYKEWNIDKDILLVDFKDTYYNLTLKTISGINWAAEYCSTVNYVISVDDDMYVATDILISHLNNIQSTVPERFYSGYVLQKSAPVRKETNTNYYFTKWIVSRGVYHWDTYPPYVFGGLVIMSQQTVFEFKFAIQYTKFFLFEDVYLGILANKLGIKAVHNSLITTFKAHTSGEYFKRIIASHFYGWPAELRKAWTCYLGHLEQNMETISSTCGARTRSNEGNTVKRDGNFENAIAVRKEKRVTYGKSTRKLSNMAYKNTQHVTGQQQVHRQDARKPSLSRNTSPKSPGLGTDQP